MSNHYDIALTNLRYVERTEMTSLNAQVTVTAAQVHATLALVEQQRIANLIAYTTANGTEPDEKTAQTIKEALEL